MASVSPSQCRVALVAVDDGPAGAVAVAVATFRIEAQGASMVRERGFVQYPAGTIRAYANVAQALDEADVVVAEPAHEVRERLVAAARAAGAFHHAGALASRPWRWMSLGAVEDGDWARAGANVRVAMWMRMLARDEGCWMLRYLLAWHASWTHVPRPARTVLVDVSPGTMLVRRMRAAGLRPDRIDTAFDPGRIGPGDTVVGNFTLAAAIRIHGRGAQTLVPGVHVGMPGVTALYRLRIGTTTEHPIGPELVDPLERAAIVTPHHYGLGRWIAQHGIDILDRFEYIEPRSLGRFAERYDTLIGTFSLHQSVALIGRARLLHLWLPHRRQIAVDSTALNLSTLKRLRVRCIELAEFRVEKA